MALKNAFTQQLYLLTAAILSIHTVFSHTCPISAVVQQHLLVPPFSKQPPGLGAQDSEACTLEKCNNTCSKVLFSMYFLWEFLYFSLSHFSTAAVFTEIHSEERATRPGPQRVSALEVLRGEKPFSESWESNGKPGKPSGTSESHHLRAGKWRE